jgi:hypothetical protein
MTSSNAKILLALLGIGLVVVAVFLVARPKNESIKALQAEVAELQTRYDDLCEKEARKDEIIAETKEFNEQFDEVLVDYPADLNQESFVMFLKGTEEAQEYTNVTVGLPRPSTFYVLGQGSAAEGAVADEEEESYIVETVAYTIGYNGSYDGLKDYLAYIENYKYRMCLSTLNIVYDNEAETPEKECTGTVTLNAYSVSGPDRTPDKPSVDVKEGKENIFADLNGGSRANTSFDEDEGASIAVAHNIVINLGNANSDTASGIIVASNESDESTYVTSSANSVEDLKFTISEKDGKNFIKYEIGSNSYETEVLSNNVTIYVKSSGRVDTNDKNGVNVSIDNTSGLSVYIKVADDDSSSPRFNLGSKTGVVKVY